MISFIKGAVVIMATLSFSVSSYAQCPDRCDPYGSLAVGSQCYDDIRDACKTLSCEDFSQYSCPATCTVVQFNDPRLNFDDSHLFAGQGFCSTNTTSTPQVPCEFKSQTQCTGSCGWLDNSSHYLPVTVDTVSSGAVATVSGYCVPRALSLAVPCVYLSLTRSTCSTSNSCSFISIEGFDGNTSLCYNTGTCRGLGAGGILESNSSIQTLCASNSNCNISEDCSYCVDCGTVNGCSNTPVDQCDFSQGSLSIGSTTIGTASSSFSSSSTTGTATATTGSDAFGFCQNEGGSCGSFSCSTSASISGSFSTSTGSGSGGSQCFDISNMTECGSTDGCQVDEGFPTCDAVVTAQCETATSSPECSQAGSVCNWDTDFSFCSNGCLNAYNETGCGQLTGCSWGSSPQCIQSGGGAPDGSPSGSLTDGGTSVGTGGIGSVSSGSVTAGSGFTDGTNLSPCDNACPTFNCTDAQAATCASTDGCLLDSQTSCEDPCDQYFEESTCTQAGCLYDNFICQSNALNGQFCYDKTDCTSPCSEIVRRSCRALSCQDFTIDSDLNAPNLCDTADDCTWSGDRPTVCSTRTNRSACLLMFDDEEIGAQSRNNYECQWTNGACSNCTESNGCFSAKDQCLNTSAYLNQYGCDLARCTVDAESGNSGGGSGSGIVQTVEFCRPSVCTDFAYTECPEGCFVSDIGVCGNTESPTPPPSTGTPTPMPSMSPSQSPATQIPTTEPTTLNPSNSPSQMPSSSLPTLVPTANPTKIPTGSPSANPTKSPTRDLPRSNGGQYSVGFSISFGTWDLWVEGSSSTSTKVNFEREIELKVASYTTIFGALSASRKRIALKQEGEFRFNYGLPSRRRSAAVEVTVQYVSVNYNYVTDVESSFANNRASFEDQMIGFLGGSRIYALDGATVTVSRPNFITPLAPSPPGDFAIVGVQPTNPNPTGGPPTAPAPQETTTEEKSSNDTLLYIIIAVIGILLIGGVILIILLKKRKNSKNLSNKVKRGNKTTTHANPTYQQGAAPQNAHEQSRPAPGSVQQEGGRKVLVLDPYGNDA